MGTKCGGTARIVFDNVELSEDNVKGGVNIGYDVFNIMMIPKRLTTATGSVGVAMAAIEIAADYATKREAFGSKIIKHEGVSFRITESLTAIHEVSSLVYTASKAADLFKKKKIPYFYIRKLVLMAKLNSTEVMWKAVNDAMQVLGGIGYTTIYPIERLLRDSRLGMIWTGTNEVMKMIIQHEFIKEIKDPKYFSTKRKVELDALDFDLKEEKVYE